MKNGRAVKQTSNTTCRRFMQIWPGGFAVWLGKLHPQKMQAVITSFTHNRYHNGLGRPLKRCEREMLELQWFSAQEFEDVIRLATPGTKISLAGMQKGDSLRRFLSENWATDFAKCPRNDDQLAFRLFCQGQGWDTSKLRSLPPKPVPYWNSSWSDAVLHQREDRIAHGVAGARAQRLVLLSGQCRFL